MNRGVWFFAAAILGIAFAIFVSAYNSNPAVPSNFGHNLNEIDVVGSTCENQIGQYLQVQVGNRVGCTGAPVGGSQWQNGAGGAISYSGGNVGIGTNSPQSKLHLKASNDIYGVLRLEGEGLASPDNQVFLQFHPDAGPRRAWIGFGDPTVAQALVVENEFTSGPILFRTSGNVGIGTNSPQSKLHVLGNAILEQPLGSAQPSLFYRHGTLNRFSSYVEFDGSKYSIGIYDNLGVLAGNAFTILRSNGNVGIGTSSPSQKLDVVGRVRTDDLTVANDIVFPAGTCIHRVRGFTTFNNIGVSDICNPGEVVVGGGAFCQGSGNFVQMSRPNGVDGQESLGWSVVCNQANVQNAASAICCKFK